MNDVEKLLAKFINLENKTILVKPVVDDWDDGFNAGVMSVLEDLARVAGVPLETILNDSECNPTDNLQ
jgi:hypothetical protein